MTKTEYLLKPNYCLECDEAIPLDETKSIAHTLIKKFCNRSCAAKYNNKRRKLTDSTKEKISSSLSGVSKSLEHKNNIKKSHTGKTLSESHKRNIIKAHKERGITPPQRLIPKSIVELSKRTIAKILKRLGIGCSYCGYDKTTGDIHHINGRKTEDADNHSNLSYLCPNCHREVHRGLIDSKELITLKEQINDRWLEYYYPSKAGL